MFRLALALGRTVEELLSSMSSRELSEWQAYYALEPFGEERADVRAGIIAAAIVNQWRGKDKAVSPLDMMPDYGGLRFREKMLKRRSGASIMAALAKYTAAMNAGKPSGIGGKPGGSTGRQLGRVDGGVEQGAKAD